MWLIVGYLLDVVLLNCVLLSIMDFVIDFDSLSNVIFFAFSLMVVQFCWRRYENWRVLSKNGIPGPRPRTIFGNLMEYLEDANAVWNNNLRSEFGDISGYYIGPKPIVVVWESELIKQIKTIHSHLFLKLPNPVPYNRTPCPRIDLTLGNLNDRDIYRMRKLMHSLLTPERVEDMIPTICDCVDKMLARIGTVVMTQPSIDLYPYFQLLVWEVLTVVVFGLDSGVQAQHFVFRYIQEAFNECRRNRTKYSRHNFISLCFPGVSRIFDYFRGIAEKSRPPSEDSRSELWKLACIAYNIHLPAAFTVKPAKDDLIKFLIDAQNGLSDNDIFNHCVLFCETAFEPLSASLGFIAHLLTNNEHIQDQLREEVLEFFYEHATFKTPQIGRLSYLEVVINDAIRRFNPKSRFINRTPTCDYKYTDKAGQIFTFPKGIHIQFGCAEMHFDEEVWGNQNEVDANKLDWNYGERKKLWQPIRGGEPVNFVDQNLASLVLKLTFSKLLQKYRLVKAPETERFISVEYRHDIRVPTYGSWAQLQLVDQIDLCDWED